MAARQRMPSNFSSTLSAPAKKVEKIIRKIMALVIMLAKLCKATYAISFRSAKIKLFQELVFCFNQGPSSLETAWVCSYLSIQTATSEIMKRKRMRHIIVYLGTSPRRTCRCTRCRRRCPCRRTPACYSCRTGRCASRGTYWNGEKQG